MQPLNYDIRSYYRKYQVAETEKNGIVTPIFETDGPISIAFRPGASQRQLLEQGYSEGSSVFFCIADGVNCIRAGDILTDGENELYVVLSVQTFPTEQTFYVRSL